MPKRLEIDLRAKLNSECKIGCNQKERKLVSEDEVCQVAVSALDSLPIRCVGSWAEKKIIYLTKYFNIFAVGMKNLWEGINYVEICSGPGRCVIRNNGKEIDGTSMSILTQRATENIGAALFIDKNAKVVDILNRRIAALLKGSAARAVVGDYIEPDSIARLLAGLPKRSLNLVFVDPTDCSFPFATVMAINNILQNVDFIINISIGHDVNRNIKTAIFGEDRLPSRSKYCSFLGGDTYFNSDEVVQFAHRNDHQNLRQLFREEYKSSLGRIGFGYFGTEQVKHYYELLFASKHPRGLEFWEKANRIDPDMQYKLDLF